MSSFDATTQDVMTRRSLTGRNARRLVRRAARRRGGFTLVELMVSLVAGLFIAMAVVGLAKTTTGTFHEEGRMSAVEAAVRNASERLRQDLTRVSFMSTGNIMLARRGVVGVPQNQAIAVPLGGAATGSRYAALNDLAGIRVVVGGSGNFAASFPGGGSGAAGPNNLSVNNGLNPDGLILSGNLTTDDHYQGTLLPNGAVAGGCGGATVRIRRNGDAGARVLLDQANPLTAMQSAFQPQAGRFFAARIVDPGGCQHYAVVCNVTMDTTTCQPGDVCGAVHLSPPVTGPAVLGPGTTDVPCGASPEAATPVTVNPVHRVRWYIGPNVDPNLDADPAVEIAGNKFNLYRELLDAADPPAPVTNGRQIVAEYATDLKFGISVDDGTAPPNNQRVFEMDTDPGGGSGNIDSWTRRASTSTAGAPGPQRVRSVRFRVAARSPIWDRRFNLIVPPGAPYLSRYCTEATAPVDCRRFARVRTIVSEVSLLNQLGMTY